MKVYYGTLEVSIIGSVIAYPVTRTRLAHDGQSYETEAISWHTDRWDAAGTWTGCGAHIRLKIAVVEIYRPGDELEVEL